MLCSRYPLPLFANRVESIRIPSSTYSLVVRAAKGPRPRYPRVWKTNKRIGTISKSAKLVHCVRGLSNVKEEVYGALDSFVAWDLEFPLIVVKKALRTLENEGEWKRIIQVAKWMLSKGQGKTMGTYYTLLNALAEDGRLDEAEELWKKLFSEKLESTPHNFFDKIISIYFKRDMHEKLFEVFADMEELGVLPSAPIVSMVGKVFLKLGMLDKYDKLKKKYPPPKWEYRYIKGKRVKVRAKRQYEFDVTNMESNQVSNANSEADEASSNELDRPNNNESDQVGTNLVSNQLSLEDETSSDELNGDDRGVSQDGESILDCNESFKGAETSSDKVSVEATYPLNQSDAISAFIWDWQIAV
ncbi:pentatricopeptide repeat-containing protein [Tripterygium wilfordii]|uniref:Pentatricopeptide repeat-containing protein n=1 Tax=Tripterygium wilfordii TaxID=458696 RepID=A0A7J7DAW2_TRIWF|nr:pentatricopeptide repeat-containing protein At4g21190-like [Tripterygium wilfordii]XP_038709869.1 pentatricopeptide repeat-containing protein At4g21190-like [Tripterygium wilfordii]KAF5743497.1 pentatricopeptide repeat-containing protein [Tripterygium wilfordii]